MNLKNASLIVIVNVVLTAFILFCFCGTGSKEVVFVDNQKLFNGFKMTQELKSLGDKELASQSQKLDSLYKILNDPAVTSRKSELVKLIIQQKQEIENYQENFTITNSDKIWKRIHGYVKDFAQENNYDIIVGNQNGDNILYGDEQNDVTLKLVSFINSKYDGR